MKQIPLKNLKLNRTNLLFHHHLVSALPNTKIIFLAFLLSPVILIEYQEVKCDRITFLLSPSCHTGDRRVTEEKVTVTPNT